MSGLASCHNFAVANVHEIRDFYFAVQCISKFQPKDRVGDCNE